MSSMLFNVALVLLATTATIQFCAQAFALYAGKSSIYNIFGVTLSNLDGLKYLYIENIFIYAMLAIMLLTLLVLLIRGPDRWKRKRPTADFYDM
jgi:LMBR1 domain-containing protein 1